MKQIIGYHHFKGNQLSVVEKVESNVVSAIINSPIPDEKRENSRCWEIKHSSGAVQIARLLAQLRGLDESIAAIAMALHDIYAIETGQYRDHARLGVPIAEKLLAQYSELSKDQVDLILEMVGQHSLKEVFTDDPYIELAKDVDVLDCFLYPDVEQYYLTAKPLSICKFYFQRIAHIRQELGLPRYPRYESLRNFAPGWLKHRGHFTAQYLPIALSQIFLESQYNPVAETVGLVALWGNNLTGYQITSESPFSYHGKTQSRSDIAELINSIPHNEDVLLVCWPDFDTYEIRQGDDAYNRLAELDVPIVSKTELRGLPI